MKVTLKAILFIVIAIALAVLGGYLWGAAGRWRAEDALARAGAGLPLAHARGNMLAARVNLFEVNFGEASRSLEAAKGDLMTAAGTLDRLDLDSEAAAAREVAARVEDARQLAGRLDQTANSRLADAIRMLPTMP